MHAFGGGTQAQGLRGKDLTPPPPNDTVHVASRDLSPAKLAVGVRAEQVPSSNVEKGVLSIESLSLQSECGVGH